MRRRAFAGVLVMLAVWCAAVPQRAESTDDAAAGYETLRPSLVKVWAFDGAGRPVESGSGVIVASSDRRASILTAAHVIAGAAAVRIDVDRRLHDIAARVEARGPRDLALLSVDRGGLTAATFAPRDRAIVEGNVVAVAGYVKHDELIGIVGQEPRLLYPGTVSSRPDDGKYLELENVHIEEGLSGGPVFDPHTGEVLGIVTSRTADARGGFADSGPLVVLAFLDAQRVAVAMTHARLTQPAPAPPAPRSVAVARTAPPAVRAPAPPAASAAPAVELASLPRAAVSRSPSTALWRMTGAPAQAFTYHDRSCTVVVSVQVAALTLAVSAHGLAASATSRPALALLVRRRTPAFDACAAYRDEEAVEGDYDPVASAFDGHHLTVRYAFGGARRDDAAGGAPATSGDALFPSDISLDVDFGGDPVIATLQLFDDDWNGALDVGLNRAAAGSASASGNAF